MVKQVAKALFASSAASEQHCFWVVPDQQHMTEAAVPPVVLAAPSFQIVTLAELQKAFDSDSWLTDVRYMLHSMTPLLFSCYATM